MFVLLTHQVRGAERGLGLAFLRWQQQAIQVVDTFCSFNQWLGSKLWLLPVLNFNISSLVLMI